MIKELFYKWFGLEPPTCLTCEVLRIQLDESNRERRDLLARLLERDKPEPLVEKNEVEYRPITPHNQFVPMAVRRQMMEAEEQRRIQLIKDKAKEMAEAKPDESIEKLEKELGVKNG